MSYMEAKKKYAKIGLDTEKVIKDKKIDIADRYESYVGREFMTKEKLEELRRIIESGEAANISEAREVYYTKNGAKRR